MASRLACQQSTRAIVVFFDAGIKQITKHQAPLCFATKEPPKAWPRRQALESGDCFLLHGVSQAIQISPVLPSLPGAGLGFTERFQRRKGGGIAAFQSKFAKNMVHVLFGGCFGDAQQERNVAIALPL